MVDQALSEESSREELLQKMFQKDIVAASFFAVGDKGEKVEDVNKLRLAQRPVVSRSKEAFAASIGDLKAGFATVLKSAKEKLGGTDPNATEAFTNFEGAHSVTSETIMYISVAVYNESNK
jgi:hypothetical protein